MKFIFNRQFLPIIAVILGIAAICAVFIVPLGVSDGGSHFRTMEHTGLFFLDTPQEGVVQTEYQTGYAFAPPTDMQEWLIIAIKDIFGEFSTRYTGFFCAFLLLAGLYFFVKGSWSDKLWHKLLTVGLSILMLCDFAYTTYFNSLFWEPIAISLTVLFVGLMTDQLRHESVSIPHLIFLTITALCLSTVSTLSALLSAVAGCAILLLFRLNAAVIKRIIALACGIAVIICSIGFAFTYRSPTYKNDLYNAVFFGAVKSEGVEALGLDPSLNQLKEKYYSDEIARTHNLEESFFNKVNYASLVNFYLTRPAALWNAINVSASNGFNPRLEYAGNYTDPLKASELASGFNLYSTVKSMAVPNTPFTIAILLILLFGIMFSQLKNKDMSQNGRVGHYSIILLGVAVIIAFIMPYMQTGLVDIGRTMIMFNLLFDLILLLGAVQGSLLIAARRSELKDKYGIKQ